jgi:hypothetical protein
VDPTGLYPAFTLLGIFDRCSPLLLSDVALLSAMLSSFDETSSAFRDRGVNLNINTILRIAERFAKRAAMAQQVCGLTCSETLDGHTVVISNDGGRIRIRKDKSGPGTAKDRRRYSTRWREPKLLIIYTWVKKHRRMLFNAGVDKVIEEIDALCQGKHSKKMATEREYFVRNKHRMRYQVLKEQNLPIGSGAVESAIRRVVDLRLKGGLYLLAGGRRRSNASPAGLLQSYPMEYVERISFLFYCYE